MSYSIDLVTKLEDDIKVKARYLERLYDDQSALKGWKQQDEEELALLNREGDYDQKVTDLKDELREVRKARREAYYNKID